MISAMPNLDGLLLDLKNVHCFVKAVEHGSLSAAATTLGIAQSALSRQVSQLESLLGCKLLHRTGRGVTLTEVGEAVLPQAELVLKMARQLMDDVSTQRDRPAGTVTVAILPALSRPLVSRLLQKVQDLYPDIRLKAIEAYSGEVKSMLADGRADIGIFNRYRPLQRDACGSVYNVPLYLVSRPGTLDLPKKNLNFSRLAELPLVLPTSPNDLRTYIDEISRRKQLKLNVVLEASSGTLIREALLNCAVCSLLPYHAVAEEVKSGSLTLTRIVNPPIHQAAFIGTTRKRPLSMAARAVYNVLLKEVQFIDDELSYASYPEIDTHTT